MDAEYIKLVDFIDYAANLRTYLHNTYSAEVAENIMSEGFNFVYDIHKTSDEMGPHNIDNIGWWDVQRSPYGDFTIVLQIDKNVFKHVSDMNAKYMTPGQLLSKNRFWNEDETDWSYVLHPRYVKGYFDRRKNEGKLNSLFDPSFFDEDTARENIRQWDEEDNIKTYDFS